MYFVLAECGGDFERCRTHSDAAIPHKGVPEIYTKQDAQHSARNKQRICEMPFCEQSTSKNKADWVQCGKCMRWLHYQCVHMPKEVVKFEYICIICTC